MSLVVRPVTIKAANAVVEEWHRHHAPARGCRFCLQAFDGTRLCGIAIVGRPKARMTEQYMACEVDRVCTDGTRNACSLLYGACARVAREMGFWWIQTFILATEPGTSLKASGWEFVGLVDGDEWDRPSRRRKAAAVPELKQKWRKVFVPEGARAV